MGLRRRCLVMIPTERRGKDKERASRGFVLQRAPAAFQAGLTPCPSGSLVGGIRSMAAEPSRLLLSWSLVSHLPPSSFNYFGSFSHIADKHPVILIDSAAVIFGHISNRIILTKTQMVGSIERR